MSTPRLTLADISPTPDADAVRRILALLHGADEEVAA